MNVRVNDGTNAGWRNPFAGRAMPWQCRCTVWTTRDLPGGAAEGVEVPKTNPGYLTACPDCGVRRPT